MYDYKSLRKIVTLLAVLFGVVFFVLVVGGSGRLKWW